MMNLINLVKEELPNVMNFVDNLGYMGVGMLIIISVIGIIIGATTLLNRFTGGK